ncbi:hypothetical protein SAMN02910358_02566 [Lachnospiraceae bacterium XBB1006]|nr:hypothetical protein SAMN02910358_02566 [Lachnospiraceae bacterium XBB1006]
MTIEQIVNNVRGSFEIESLSMSEKDRLRGIAILQGTLSADKAVAEIIRSNYASNSNIA